MGYIFNPHFDASSVFDTSLKTIITIDWEFDVPAFSLEMQMLTPPPESQTLNVSFFKIFDIE